MKFWKKLVLFIIAMISIILSCSRYYIVKNNFAHSIKSRIDQNTSKHTMQRYMIESKIVKDIQDGKMITEESITEYLENLHKYMDNNLDQVAVYSGDYTKIYSNIDKIDKINIRELLNDETDNYLLKKIDNENYMLFLSHWSINDRTTYIYIVNAYNVEDIFEERDRQMNDILITDLIILGVSFVVISIFSIFVTKPIKELNIISKKIANGRLDERAEIKSKDEIGELAESFNIMANEIENKINELNLSVKKKDDFITGFTHELKTPMTAIIGYSDLLRTRRCDEEVSKKAISYIYSEAKRLENLSFKLMQMMSLVEENIELQPIEVKKFINKILESEEMIFRENKIIVDIEEYNILGDKELLEVVIKNLVQNASKADPKDNKILIKGRIIGKEKYRISVIDKGRGIPKEHIERVTEDFYMVDKSRGRTNGGSGIGLSLVSKILKSHNAKLNIESEENVGTTVYFELEGIE